MSRYFDASHCYGQTKDALRRVFVRELDGSFSEFVPIDQYERIRRSMCDYRAKHAAESDIRAELSCAKGKLAGFSPEIVIFEEWSVMGRE